MGPPHLDSIPSAVRSIWRVWSIGSQDLYFSKESVLNWQQTESIKGKRIGTRASTSLVHKRSVAEEEERKSCSVLRGEKGDDGVSDGLGEEVRIMPRTERGPEHWWSHTLWWGREAGENGGERKNLAQDTFEMRSLHAGRSQIRILCMSVKFQRVIQAGKLSLEIHPTRSYTGSNGHNWDALRRWERDEVASTDKMPRECFRLEYLQQRGVPREGWRDERDGGDVTDPWNAIREITVKTVTQVNDVWSSEGIIRELANGFGQREAMGQLNKNSLIAVAEK